MIGAIHSGFKCATPKITKITFIIIIFLISSLRTSMAKEKWEKIWR